MKISYEQVHDVAYIQFRAQDNEVETLSISDELNLDISSDGRLFGIELLNATEQLKLKGEEHFTKIETSSGDIEIRL